MLLRLAFISGSVVNGTYFGKALTPRKLSANALRGRGYYTKAAAVPAPAGKRERRAKCGAAGAIISKDQKRFVPVSLCSKARASCAATANPLSSQARSLLSRTPLFQRIVFACTQDTGDPHRL